MGATEVIKTRLTPEDKARVANVTQMELLSESIWLRRLVLRELQAAQPARAASDVLTTRGRCSTHRGAASRLNVRLRTEDRLLLHERAAARGMASATYISVLVRAHLRALAPLPKDELVALKRAVAELGAIGRNLNQIARAAHEGSRVADIGRDEFRAILKVCEALRDHTKNLIKTNTASWASGHAEPDA
jgi:Bacterial mobilisation protein (MobC)